MRAKENEKKNSKRQKKAKVMLFDNLKALGKWEFYEDILVAVLRFLFVKPYFLFKNSKNWKYAGIVVLIFALVSGYLLLRNPDSAAAEWWNDQWSYRKQLTIDSDEVTADLENFPMLVSVTDSDLADKAQSDGGDIIFVDAEGKKLVHEIESFNDSTGALVAWVKIPLLDADADSYLYMYYGNANVEDQQKPTEVWDDDYVMVQHMNEEGTSTRFDSTRNNNDGTPQNYDGDEATSSGKINGADDLEAGDSTNILIADNESLDQTAEFTISAWINMETLRSYNSIFSKSDGSATNYDFLIANDEVRLYFEPGYSYEDTTAANLSAGQTYYVTVTFNDAADSIIFYVNGSVSADNGNAESNTPASDANERARIGAWTSADHFDGITDEVRFSKVARSADWIETSFNNQNAPATFLSAATEEVGPGPVGYWSFDEGYGTTAYDSSGQGNDGTITDAVWQDESMCVSGSCLYFDGDDDYVQIADDDTLDLTAGGYTISAWIRPHNWGDSSNGRIICHGGGASPSTGWAFHVDDLSATEGLAIQVNNTSAHSERSDANAVTLNEWQHAVVTFDGVNTITFYVDGVEQGIDSSHSGHDPLDSSDPIRIGMRASDTAREFEGFIDEVKVYPYARTAEQVKVDYAAGLAGEGSSHGLAASFGKESDRWLSDGLVGYWKMDEASWDGTSDEVVDSSGNEYHGTAGSNDTGTSTGSNTGTTLNDTGKTWTVDAYAEHNLTITGGTGSGQTRTITSNTATQLTITTAWSTTPDATSTYRITSTSSTGKFGNGSNFSITGDYISAGDVDEYEDTSQISMSAWVYATGADNTNMGIGGKVGAGDDTFFLRHIATSEVAFEVTNTSQTVAIAEKSTDIDDGSWHHVVGVYDGNEVRVYYDGEVGETTAALSGNTYVSNQDFKISDTGGAPWEGIIDEVRVYNRALSAREIKALYEWAPGPVGYWKLDEKVSGDAQAVYDSSGNENHGTTEIGGNGTGMDCTVSGKYGSACEFDVVDDHISLPSNSDLQVNTNYTISAWAKISGDTADAFHREAVIGRYFGWDRIRYDYDQAQWEFDIATDGTDPTGISIPDSSINTWRHVSYSYDGSNFAAYFNGVLIDSTTATGASTYFDQAWQIGANGSDLWVMNGLVDDVRIYNYARTQDQIIEDMNAGHPAGGSPVGSPVAYWKFDEGYGSTANDEMGNYDGTLSAGGSGGNSSETEMWELGGRFGKAIEFDGSNDKVTTSAFDLLDTYTVSMWYRNSAAPVTDRIDQAFCWNSTSDRGICFSWDHTNTDFIQGWSHYDDNYEDLKYTTSLQADTWYHMVLTYDETTVRAYLDGIEEVSAVADAATDSGTEIVSIGAGMGGTSDYDDGVVDEVKIFNYAMTADQVKTEYNAGQSVVMGSDPSRDNDGTAVTGQSMKYCVPGASDPCDPPVLELDFNEKSGTTAYDKSGNGNDGTLGGGTAQYEPSWTEGKLGAALDFDGSDDLVSVIDDVAIQDVFDDGGTISGWIRSADGGGRILYKTSPSGWYLYASDYATSGHRLYFSQDFDGTTGDWRNYSNRLPYNQWNHFTVTYNSNSDTNEPTFYVNGKLESTDAVTPPSGTRDSDVGTNLYIGNRGDTGGPFEGEIDEIKVYDYIRTPAQIAWDYSQGEPVAHWKFDDCSGSTVHDDSRACRDNGDCNDGTIELGGSGVTETGTCSASGSTFWYNGRTGKYGSAGDFDGASDYINIPNSTELSELDALTMSVWLKPEDSMSGYNDVIIKRPYVRYCMTIYGNEFSYYDGNTGRVASGYTLTQDEWVHLAVSVANNDQVVFYVNGAEYSSSNYNYTMLSGSDPLEIGGAGAGGTEFVNGQIDEVKIWNYKLTPQQIKNEYNRGAVSFQ
jgi:hypothetical protein